MSGRISTEDMRNFLMSIAGGPNGSPTGECWREELDIRAEAAATACEHLPASILDDRAIGDALRSFDVWPSAAAIYQFLRIRVRDAAPPSPPAPRVVRSEMPPYQNNKKVETNDDAL